MLGEAIPNSREDELWSLGLDTPDKHGLLDLRSLAMTTGFT